MTYERRSFSGAAVATTIPAGIPDAVGLGPFTVGATTNWPNTAIGPFIVSLNIGLADEEKVKVASYTSTTFTCATGGRGWDGTTAQSHAGAVAVACTLDANTVDALNSFANLNGTVVGSTSAVGDTATTGSSSAPAAADHKHAREAFGTDVATSAVGDTGTNGSGTTVAHSNHQHPRESAATLTAGLAYGSVTPTASAAGDAGAPGTATTPARADHKHGRESKAGIVEMFAGSSTPTNALPCDGSAVSRTTYATLFTAIGTTWGVGDGTTTFNVPDMRGRAAIGAGAGAGLTSRALAAKGGEETHLLITSEMPSHAHGIGGGVDNFFVQPPTGTTSASINAGLYGAGGTLIVSQGPNTDSTGGGGAHNNMQPWVAVNYIVWTL